MDASDIELMQRVHDSQEAAAFEELMHRYQRPVIGFLLRMVNNPTLAQDLAEETFVRVWQSAGRYRPKAKFTTWLFTIASRLATDQLRRAQVRQSVPLDQPAIDDGPTPADRLADPSPTADEALAAQETARQVRQAIQSLPVDQRTALLLCEFEGLSYAEAAEVMESSVKSVELRIYRAKQHLREKLKNLI